MTVTVNRYSVIKMLELVSTSFVSLVSKGILISRHTGSFVTLFKYFCVRDVKKHDIVFCEYCRLFGSI